MDRIDCAMFLPITMVARPTCPSCQKFNARFEKNLMHRKQAWWW
jgi:predicted DsbA family dithiol-disulfide isomerase